MTHATPHTRYADRPEDVPLEETPWLLDTGGLDDHSNMVSVQGRGMVNVMEIGSHQPVPAHQHMSTGRNAVESSAPTHTLGQDLTSIAIDPNLQTAALSTASNNVQASSSDPFSSVGSPATSAPLPYIMPLSSSSTSRPVGNTLNQPLATTTQPSSSSLEAGSSTSAPFALATNPAQGQSMNGGNTAGIDRVRGSCVLPSSLPLTVVCTGARHARRILEVPASVSGHSQSARFVRGHGCETIRKGGVHAQVDRASR